MELYLKPRNIIDRIAVYGNADRPTWCNMLARDLLTEVTGSDPFDGVKSAAEIFEYMKANPELFTPLDDGDFENAWKNHINKNEIVLFVDSGHIAIGIPTAEKEMLDKSYTNSEDIDKKVKVGMVIQAGKSHGAMTLSSAWKLSKFKNIKIYKYVQVKQ